MICDWGKFLATVQVMLLAFNQNAVAHIICCMCCAQVSSGIGRLSNLGIQH